MTTATKTRKPRSDKGIKKGPKTTKVAAAAPLKVAGFPVSPKTKKTAGGGTCLFSGEATQGKRSRFLPGYDAKLKSLLIQVIKGEAKKSEIPTAARKALEEGPVVGYRINAAGEVIKSRAAA